MKVTGIVRRIDELGRIVLPSELRKTMEMNVGDSVEIFVDGNKVVLKKYQPACMFCGSTDETVMYKDKLVCKECIEVLNKLM